MFRGIAGLDESGAVRLNVYQPSVAEAAIGWLEAIVPADHILCWRAVQHQAKPTKS